MLSSCVDGVYLNVGSDIQDSLDGSITVLVPSLSGCVKIEAVLHDCVHPLNYPSPRNPKLSLGGLVSGPLVALTLLG